MAIRTYSKSRDGETYLSSNRYFKVKEFACKDGSDTIKIDDALIVLLDKIRGKFGPVTVTSGYRTVSYNSSIGGASGSKHCLGQAADIKVSGATPLKVCIYAQEIGVKGLGWYPDDGNNFTHVDSRTTKSFWCISSSDTVSVIPPTIREGCGMKRLVKYLQDVLNITQDGIWGPNTTAAVKAFQRSVGLTDDGIVGPKTWAKLDGRA